MPHSANHDRAATATALATSAALAAALAVPLHLAVFSERIFEAEKAGLLRLLGIVAAASLLAAWVADRAAARHAEPRERDTARLRAAIGTPLGAAALATCLAATLATLLSVAPTTSLLGSYDRGQGLATMLALLALFAATVLLAADGAATAGPRRSPEPSRPPRVGLHTLALALALPAWPAALYGLVQRYGLDPLPWLGDVVTRISGPAGSSVLYAAHLAMVLPFVVLGALRAWRAAVAAGRRWDPALAAWATTLLATLWALLLAGSRGPVVGLAGGAIVAILAWAATHGRKRTALATLVLAMGLALAVLGLNAQRDHLGAARNWPLVGRIAVALDPSNSTTRVRLRLWEGSIDALGDRGPLRLLVGTGPETMDLTWAPHYPPILAHDEPRGIVPDRAHNLLLDTLLTEGLLGAAALVAFFTAAIATALRLLGLQATRRDRRAFLVAWLGGGLAAGTLVWALGAASGDLLALASPAAGLGAAAGLSLWLAARALGPGRGSQSPPAPTRPLPPDRGFALAALATIVVAWLELQVGFGVTSTRLLLWLVAGGLLGATWSRAVHGLGARVAADDGTHGEIATDGPRAAIDGEIVTDDGTRPRPAPRPNPTGSPPPAFFPLVVGATLVFAFARPGLVGGGAAIVAALLVASVVAVAAMVGCRARAVLVVTLVLLGQLVAQGLLLALLPHGASDAVPAALASYGLYVLVLLGAIVWRAAAPSTADGAVAEGTTAVAVRPSGSRGAPIALLRVSLALAAAALSTPLWLLPTAADAYYKEGRLAWEQPVMDLARRGASGRAEASLDQAIARYERAVRLAPYESRYRLRIGYAEDTRAVLLDERLSRALAQAGIAAPPSEYDPALLDGYALDLATRRDAAFTRALTRFAEADRRSGRQPGSPTPHLARARALRLWGDLTREPERRAARLADARAAYAEIAATIAPRWPEVLHEDAVTALLAGDPDAAVTLSRRAVARDPLYSAPFKTLATALAAHGDTEDAIVAWELYQRDPRNAGDAAALRGQLSALLAAGHPHEAIAVAERLVIVTPADARAHADLAIALEGAGEADRALEAARAAAALAPGDPAIADLLEGLARPE